ncbi:hypothetical protein [Acholeplasma hippikon]|nr:hypothetical protein [Acholeplasma hippikon]
MKYLSNLFITFKEQLKMLKTIDKKKRLFSVLWSILLNIFIFLPIYLIIGHLYLFNYLIYPAMFLMLFLTLFMIFLIIYLKYYILKVKYGEAKFKVHAIIIVHTIVYEFITLILGLAIITYIGVLL